MLAGSTQSLLMVDSQKTNKFMYRRDNMFDSKGCIGGTIKKDMWVLYIYIVGYVALQVGQLKEVQPPQNSSAQHGGHRIN